MLIIPGNYLCETEKKRKRRIVMKKKIVLGMLVLSVCLLGNASAGTVTWTGGGDGINWSDAANWDPAVPSISDDVVINSGTPTHDDDDINVDPQDVDWGECKSLTIGGGTLTT